MYSQPVSHNVIVLGGHTTALYVVRSLGRCGARVAVVDDASRGEARFSKYCDLFLKIDQFNGDAVVEVIDKIVQDFGPCAIFPTNDEAVKALSQSIDSISPENIPVVAPWSTASKAYDKQATYELARACDVPIPRTFYVESGQSIQDISRQCEYPVLIKPTTTAVFRSAFGAKAIAANDQSELTSHFREVAKTIEPHDLLVQEFVPGSNRHFWHYGAVFDRREAIVQYVISRKRQYPIDFGTASHAEIADNPEVAELGSRILASMEFLGPAEVQFKFDKRNNKYQLLDVNPRFWKSCSIAELLNVNMPMLAYKSLSGNHVTPLKLDVDEKLVWFDLLPDIFVSMQDLFARRLTLAEWSKSYKGKRIEATFARDDWLPGVLLIAMAPYLFFKGTN